MRHPLVVARHTHGLSLKDLAAGIRAAAGRRGLRSGTDEARIRKWQRGVIPSEESQIYIAEAFGWPDDIVPRRRLAELAAPHDRRRGPAGTAQLRTRSQRGTANRDGPPHLLH